ncbi:aminotransferase class IV family protein [Aminobacter aganoensis]|uniref:Probable branched-chain-amino-acid aminotransferase n=1 Tax=Aminobacter aganoensis TaxID=83264 RepID=A0A7X0F8P3_9HYPH|nr:aminotransferase class IV family protein [Aminobacter aganoensis]MBB6355196.1 4-amino-4-deoxychorismate lyase [Aminobacter aganoensis]
MSSESTVRDGLGSGFELIETMRWEPQGGFLRGGRHLARLKASAETLGFGFDGTTIEQALTGATGGDTPLRIRLVLGFNGKAEVTSHPFVPLAPDAVWTVRIASTRLASTDPLLRHKTTRREAYDAARAEFPRDDADEVLLLNEAGEVCEGTITNLFIDMGDGGPLRTPPLACGLLAGVLRGEMIDRGEAVEAKVTVHDLAAAPRIFVGNSLRGLIGARVPEARLA